MSREKGGKAPRRHASILCDDAQSLLASNATPQYSMSWSITMVDDQHMTRRGFWNATAGAVAFPYVITTAALGNEDEGRGQRARDPGPHRRGQARGASSSASSRRCKGAQSVAVADAYKDRRELRAGQCGGKAYADFRELLARAGHRRGGRGHARPLARADRHHGRPRGQGLLRREAAGPERRARPGLPPGLPGAQPRLPVRHAAAQLRALPDRLRAGPQRPDRQDPAPSRSSPPTAVPADRPRKRPCPPGFDYETWLGPAPAKPYTVDRCNPQGTYWIYDQSIGYLGGWGAHPLDILVWGCDADLAGPWTVEGTGKVPETGLYDTVYDWDMKFAFAGGVTMTFKPGSDSTKFIGSEGWIRIWREGWDAEPKSLLKETTGPNDVHLHHQHRTTTRTSSTR